MDDRLVPLAELQSALDETIARGKRIASNLTALEALIDQNQAALAEHNRELIQLLVWVKDRIAFDHAERDAGEWWKNGGPES